MDRQARNNKQLLSPPKNQEAQFESQTNAKTEVSNISEQKSHDSLSKCSSMSPNLSRLLSRFASNEK